MAILRWKRRTGWAALTISAGCALVLVLLISSTVLDKETADWGKAVLFVLGAVAVAATLLSAEHVPWRARQLSSWLQPRPISALFAAIFVALGVATDALSLLEPRPSVESRPGAIEGGVEQIKGGVAEIKVDVRRLLNQAEADEPPDRITQALPGLWGAQNCTVTFRFAIRNRSLTIDAERRPPGAPPYRLVATITSAQGDVLEVRGEEPASAEGAAATFTYTDNGATQRLMWDDQVSPHPSELKRCA